MIYGVVYIDNIPYPIVHLVNSAGEDTEDLASAVSVVIAVSDGNYEAMDVSPRQIHRLH